jgi:hypothetical protein
LAWEAFREAVRSYRVTLPALIAYFINQGFTNKIELAKKVETACIKLPPCGVNFQIPEDIQKNFSAALYGMARRGLIKNRDNLLIRNPYAIRYYANTVAHHLDGICGPGWD